MSADCPCDPNCVMYGNLDDLSSAGIPAAALASISNADKQKALVRASNIASTFLRDRYTLPLSCPYDPALVQWVCWIAVYLLMSTRGFNPNQGIDQIVVMNYKEALDSLKRVANGQQQLCVRQAIPASAQPDVATNPSRGYGGLGGVDAPIVGPNTWGF